MSRTRLEHPLIAAGLVLVVCVGVYWVRLGATGLSMSEGHRAIPGWQMRHSGHWLVPRLFDQVYLRKPPGVSWAVAASSSLLGDTELGARAPSALAITTLALGALALARRWYGPGRGLAGALAMALLPLLWEPGRSAEIEAIHTAAVALACLLVLDILVHTRGGTPRPRSPQARAIALALALGATVTIAGLAKGPAGLPCLGAAIAAACLVRRSARAALAPALWIGLTLGALALGLLAWLVLGAIARTGEAVVTQGPGEFLWTLRKLTSARFLDVLATPILALGSGLPAVLAIPFALAPRPAGDPGADASSGHARALARTILLALAAYTLLGVDNPRYTMPALALAPMLVPPLLGSARGRGDGRGRLARALLLGDGRAWLVLLVIGAGAWIGVFEPRRREKSGREPGIALGASLPDSAAVWADGLIEARPEVLWYATREAQRAGRTIHVGWRPGMAREGWLPAPGSFLILRDDSRDRELTRYAEGGLGARLEPIGRGAVHHYDFHILRVREP